MVASKSTALNASASLLLQSAAAGALLSVPFWQTDAGWLLIPCLVSYLWWLDQKPTTKQIWLSGVSFFAITVNWMYKIHATELIPSNLLASLFLALTFAIVVGSLSLGFLLFGWLYNRYRIDLKQPRSLLLVPVIWLVGEWARSCFFSIVSFGPGGSIGPHWNFGSLAFAASVTPLSYAGRMVGQFGLSGLAILTALGVFYLLRRQWKWGSVALGSVMAICATGWLLSPSPDGSLLRVGVLQLDDNNYSDYGYQRDLEAVVASHNPVKPLDLLVLPEYSYIFTHKEYKQAEIAALAKLTTDKSLVITSQSGEGEAGRKNLVTFYQSDGQIKTQQEKQFLIPGGEYIPYFYEWILVLSGNTSVIGAHQAEHQVAATDKTAQPVAYKSDKIGALACSGAIAPDFYRQLTAGGATVLTNSAALSTMGLSSSYYAQAKQMARFIAVSNARPFVQSARGGEVYALDSSGQTVVASDKAGVHYIEGTATTNSASTPYNKLGDSLLLGGLTLLLILCFNVTRAVKTHQKKS